MPASSGGVDGAALDKGLLLTGEFRRADGEAMLGAIRTIDRTPLAVVVEVPRRVAYHSIAAVRKIVAVAVGVAIVLAIIVAVLMARRVTRPIKALVDFAGDLANRRFERRVTIMARDELGVLGQALEGAASELAQSEENMRRELAIRADLGRYPARAARRSDRRAQARRVARR
jgi:HAMP domain-containing protein